MANKLPENVIKHISGGGKAFRESWENGSFIFMNIGVITFSNEDCERIEFRSTGSTPYFNCPDDFDATDWVLN